LAEDIAGRSMKAKLFTWLRVIMSLSLLAWLLVSIGAGSTFEVVAQGSPGYLLASFGVYLLGVGVRAFRWRILLKAQGIAVPLRRLTSLYFVGAFFGMFLPTGVGGDAVRMVEIARDAARDSARDSDSMVLSASTVLADRGAGLLVLFAVALISLPFSHQLVTPQVTALILILSLLGVGGVILLLEQSLIDSLAQRIPPLAWLLQRKQVSVLYHSLERYDWGALAGAAATSLLFNVLLLSTNLLIARAVGVDIAPGYFLLFVPIISFLLALPVSVSGLGIREGGYVYLFGQAGVSSPTALSMSLCFYAITVGTGLIGGIIYALQGLMGLREGRR